MPGIPRRRPLWEIRAPGDQRADALGTNQPSTLLPRPTRMLYLPLCPAG
jgi:hypothetical protein